MNQLFNGNVDAEFNWAIEVRFSKGGPETRLFRVVCVQHPDLIVFPKMRLQSILYALALELEDPVKAAGQAISWIVMFANVPVRAPPMVSATCRRTIEHASQLNDSMGRML
ncbi:hypothetical protein [Parasedimentitalea psychrophila]|uniref:Uncharacterized protein n=1 Tax=Parasedimentitalea psychrophila TaxID=2997337 RepID=A0A9Y2KZA3_9RHOB|nr:hypothetical protein [Parasedimentitalea psychrophila]WIY24771.1 hypothetical protein QPJ95_20005 [Parasedimentitalea psychrophila]